MASYVPFGAPRLVGITGVSGAVKPAREEAGRNTERDGSARECFLHSMPAGESQVCVRGGRGQPMQALQPMRH